MIDYQIKADIALIEDMINPIISSLEENEVNFKKIYQVNLALEEIFANIARYAYPSQEGMVYVSYEVNKEENKLKVIIRDQGIEFNPLEKEDPDLDSSVKERKIGGLGIYIVKNIVDNVEYQRINNENILRLEKNL